MKKPELRGAGGNSGFCFGLPWIAPVAPEASFFKRDNHNLTCHIPSSVILQRIQANMVAELFM
jgi:hypothetical protein